MCVDLVYCCLPVIRRPQRAVRRRSAQTLLDNALLIEIMELREEVDSASSDVELRPLLASCRERQARIRAALAAAFRDGEDRLDDARRETAKLRYWTRLEAAIVDRMEH